MKKDKDWEYTTIFRSMPTMQLLLQENGTVVDASDHWLGVFKWSRREVVDRNIFDLFPESESNLGVIATMKHKLKESLEIESHVYLPNLRYDVLSKDGKFEPKFWDIDMIPIKYDGGALVVFLIRLVSEDDDVSDLIAPGYRPNIFKLLVESIKDYAIFMLDPDGYICTWNLGAERMKQYTAKEAIGKHFSIFFIKQDLDKRKPEKELDNARKYGKTEDEFWRVKKDGTLIWVNVVITALYDDTHKLIGFVKVTKDLTERKNNEEQVIKAYEESSRLKAEFLANMSHEIRTPMNGIVSAANLLSSSSKPEEQKELIDIIIKSSNDMSKMVSDILDYSKLESDRTVQVSEPFELKREIESLVDGFRKNLDKPLQISTEFSEKFPVQVLGDRLRFHQVLLNLVDNAIKFTQKGQVKIKANWRIAENQDNQDYIRGIVHIEVEDTGPGIEERDLKRLFIPFSQLESFVTKRFRGTGMGLSISKRLVELMGGTIYVHSQVGKGSTFTIEMPVQITKSKSHAIEDILQDEQDLLETKKVDTNSNILLVEDNDINQKVISKVLRKIGFNNIDLASDGEEGVYKIKTKMYDFVFMDIQMPKMDGLTATKMIREEGFDTLPIVALTANALRDDAEKCKDAGMNDYISKPIKIDMLEYVLKKYLPAIK